jgi:hypothetical protein
VQNVLSSGRLSYQNGFSEPLPTTVRAGTRLHLAGSGFNAMAAAPLDLTLVLDGSFALQTAGGLTTHAGLEFSPSPYLTGRAGLDGGQPTAGLSLRYAGLGFHYAYQARDGFAGSSANYFSLTFDERGWPPETPSDAYLAKRLQSR